MRQTLRSLEILYESTRAPDEASPSAEVRAKQEKQEREKQRRIAALSPYKQAEYQTLECIKQLRESLRQSETLEATLKEVSEPSSSSSTRTESAGNRYQQPYTTDKTVIMQDLARSRLSARRAHQQLQKLHRDVQRLRNTEAEDSPSAGHDTADGDGVSAAVTYHELLEHIERAKAWYREAFGIHVMSSLDDPLVMGGAPALAKAMSGLGSPTMRPAASGSAAGPLARVGARAREEAEPDERQRRNWREDGEFQQFFLRVEQNDALIDESLDRIHAGVLRLRDNAVLINDELDVQAALLNETEQKMDRNTEGVRDLNRRLGRAIRELDNSDVCMYLVCLIILIAILCVLLRLVQ